MSNEYRNLYEGMFIVSSMLTDEARQKVVEKITKGITDHKGEVKKMHEMGLKKLSYEIDGRKDGYYFLLYFEVQPSAISELWQEYHLYEDLMRFMTLRTDTILDSLTFKPLEETAK